MKFCQKMLNETVTLLNGNKLKYPNSILIGENAAGKSEVLKKLICQSKRTIYFIDSVNRYFDIRAIKPIGEKLKYSKAILKTRLEENNFNLKDTWAYYGTLTERIELVYLEFEEKLQSLLFECLGTRFSIAVAETQEVQYESGDVGRLSSGYQAVVRVLLELLYFQATNTVKGENEKPLLIIDEIDEYLSPKTAVELYNCINKNFIEMDFIFTTHSAEVVTVSSNSNLLIMHESNLEILDVNDYQTIDEVMTIFKNVFNITSDFEEKTQYAILLRQLFNNRIAGIWGENEINSYNSILVNKLTATEKLLYRQIGDW